jgi:hypothetical protein
MKRIFHLPLVALLLWCFCCTVLGNDSSYYVSGNQLVPVDERNISVIKEVLTIEMGDDGYAYVDVDYVFRNNGPAKSITMGFEASLPYNGGLPSIHPMGIHPYIKNFTVEVNSESLPYSSGIVIPKRSMEPLDMQKWHYEAEASSDAEEGMWDLENGFLTDGKDSVRDVACAYYFKAHFKHGLNRVHHTYSYCMGTSVISYYNLDYNLTPALRWANHRIDDFTLRIGAKKGVKHFWILDPTFRSAPFRVVSGKGKVRHLKGDPDKFVYSDYTEVTLRHGMLEWKAKNFQPIDELYLTSPMNVQAMIGTTYDTAGISYAYNLDFKSVFGREPKDDDEKQAFATRVLRNMPYAGRGYVFRDQHLRKFFSSQWWYMPDPSWKMSADDFSEHDMKLINENK